MVQRPANETVQVNLRIKESFRRRIERSAEKAGVSLNAEMVRRLEESYRQEGWRPPGIASPQPQDQAGLSPLLRAAEQEKFKQEIIDTIKTTLKHEQSKKG